MKLKLITFVLFCAICITFYPFGANAFASSKYSGIVIDIKSGRTLYSDRADQKRFPASLTKIMTLYLLFEELEAGRFKLDTSLVVSKYAAAQAPTTLGLKMGQSITVHAAMHALAVKSANDVAVVIAEAIAGSENAFARRMTRTAHALGMKNT